MTEAYTCPYCNALFPYDQAPVTARGPSCPRCGEPLPALHSLEEAVTVRPAGAGRLNETITARQPMVGPPPNVKPLPANLIVGLIVVVVMAVMAWVGLDLALRTQEDRRRNDSKSGGEWAGLHYLPADCNVLAAIDLGDLTVKDKDKDFEAKHLLDEPKPALLEMGLAQLEDLTGLKLDALDHAVLGAKVQGKQVRFTLVVVTKEKYDPAIVVKKLKGETIGKHHDMPVYAFTSLFGEGRLWCPEQRIILLSYRPQLPGLAESEPFKKGDFSHFIYPPRKDNSAFDEEIRTALDQRLPKSSLAWIVGHGDWQSTIDAWKGAFSLIKGKLAGDARDLRTAAQVSTFLVSLDRDLTLRGYLLASSKEGTAALKKLIEEAARNNPKLTFAVEPDDRWISLQRRFSLDEVRGMLMMVEKKAK